MLGRPLLLGQVNRVDAVLELEMLREVCFVAERVVIDVLERLLLYLVVRGLDSIRRPRLVIVKEGRVLAVLRVVMVAHVARWCAQDATSLVSEHLVLRCDDVRGF